MEPSWMWVCGQRVIVLGPWRGSMFTELSLSRFWVLHGAAFCKSLRGSVKMEPSWMWLLGGKRGGHFGGHGKVIASFHDHGIILDVVILEDMELFRGHGTFFGIDFGIFTEVF